MKCPSCGHIFDAKRVFLEPEPDFEDFWRSYPRKQARKDALRAWHQTAKSRPSLPDLLAALATAKLSQAWQSENGRFVPFAASWLRAERWTDSLPVAREDGTVSARECWRKIALLTEGPDTMYLKSWVEASWDGLDLKLTPKTASAALALRAHWGELVRLAQDYDVQLKGDL